MTYKEIKPPSNSQIQALPSDASTAHHIFFVPCICVYLQFLSNKVNIPNSLYLLQYFSLNKRALSSFHVTV